MKDGYLDTGLPILNLTHSFVYLSTRIFHEKVLHMFVDISNKQRQYTAEVLTNVLSLFQNVNRFSFKRKVRTLTY